MPHEAQGVHNSYGTAPIWTKALERKDVDVSSAYQQKLKNSNIHDFAKKYSENQFGLTGGATIW